jgi:hypothetical protein
MDENLMSRALARALSARNIDVTTALEEDMIEQPDAAHLDSATAHCRVPRMWYGFRGRGCSSSLGGDRRTDGE